MEAAEAEWAPGVTSSEAGLSGAGAEQGAGHLGAAPRGRELTREGAGPVAALDTTAGGAAAEAASTEAEEAEAGVREEDAGVSAREAPSQGEANVLVNWEVLQELIHFSSVYSNSKASL